MTALRTILPLVCLALSVSTALAAQKIPLRDGLYHRAGACANDDKGVTIGIYTLSNGNQLFLPEAEGKHQCLINKLSVNGNLYSGIAECSAGTHDVPDGTYRFSYNVLDGLTFISRGAKYAWCSEYR